MDVVEKPIIEAVAFKESDAPEKKGIAYKVFRVRNGKLYPPMVANPGNEDTPIGVWLDAQEGEFAGLSKTGRPQVKSTGSGNLSYRPGWHLGDVPRAKQFDRMNKQTGEPEFPKDFVWAECEYAMDVDYQHDSDEQGYMRTKVDDEGNVITYRSDKYQHSLAGLPRLPKNGYYRYRTNPNPDTVPWVITGKMKVNRLLSDEEVNDILKSKGIEPIHRQGGDKTLAELGLKESFQEDVDKDIEKVSQAFGTTKEPFMGPSYILPNGEFLKIREADTNITQTGSGDRGAIIHLDVQKWLNRQAGKDARYVDDIELEERCIRVNTDFLEHYIVLPKEMPNERQMSSLREWIEFFYEKTGRELVLVSYYGPAVTYGLGAVSDDILVDIMDYYARGMSFFEGMDDDGYCQAIDEYFDEMDDPRCDSPIFLTDEPYKVKRMLERGDKAYRIYYDKGTNMFLIQDAIGNQTHTHMINAAYKAGWIPEDAEFAKNLDTDLEGFMVFMPFGYGHELRYHTTLGTDEYYDCRVYPYGVMYVRHIAAYGNPLIQAMGKPERELHFDEYDERVELRKGESTYDLDLGMDLDGDPNSAIDIDVPGANEGLDERIVKKGSKWQVQSEKGRNLGTYDTKKEAEKRLKQVHYFKHVSEDLQETDDEKHLIKYYEDAGVKISKDVLGGSDYLDENGYFIHNSGSHGNAEDRVIAHYKGNEDLIRQLNGWITYHSIQLNSKIGERYILLTKEPNEEQYRQLTNWLDKYFNTLGSMEIDYQDGPIGKHLGNKTYNASKCTVDDIIKAIKTFYTTGKLVDGINNKNPTNSDNINESFERIPGAESIILTDDMHRIKDMVSNGKYWKLVRVDLFGDEAWLICPALGEFTHGDMLDNAISSGYVPDNVNNNFDNCIILMAIPNSADASMGWEALVDYDKATQYEYEGVKIVDIRKGNIDSFDNTLLARAFGKPISVKEYSNLLSEGIHEDFDFSSINLTEEDRDELIKRYKREYPNSNSFNGRSMYITPDGTYLDIGDAHCDSDWIIEEYFQEKFGMDEFDAIDALYEVGGGHIAENLLGFVHVGNDHYNYLGIPNNEITKQQYDAMNSYYEYHIDKGWGYTIEAYVSIDPFDDEPTTRRAEVWYDEEDGFVNRYGRKIDPNGLLRNFYRTGSFKMRESLRGQTMSESKEDWDRFRAWCNNDGLYDLFLKLKDRLPNEYRDIYSLMRSKTPEDLMAAIKDVESKPTRGERDAEAKEGAELLYDENGWKVYKINTIEASKKYGKGTKWCISGEAGHNAEDHWGTYEGKVYFYINGDDKYALVWKRGDKSWQAFNAKDEIIPFIPNAPRVKGLPNVSELPSILRQRVARAIRVKPEKVSGIQSADGNDALMAMFKDFGSHENYVVTANGRVYYVIGGVHGYEDITDELFPTFDSDW